MKTAAIGFFDGVHLGHQAILKGADTAITFLDHPLAVLRPAQAPQLITSYDERIRRIFACGVKEVVTIAFTPELSRLTPEEFAARHLAGFRIRCGENWRFGHGGTGDAGWLRDHGYEVETVPLAEYAGAPVSSTRIREALARGDSVSASAMLSTPSPRVSRTCNTFHGKGQGRRIGYPTINVKLGGETAGIERGVYSAVVNYGTAPTFGEEAWLEPVMEVHLLDYLRAERRFPSVEALKAQIADDVERARDAAGRPRGED